jgi:hypothetical protein
MEPKEPGKKVNPWLNVFRKANPGSTSEVLKRKSNLY